MNSKVLLALWGILFIICAGLGFIPEASWGTTLASVLFFVPPGVLLWRGQHVRLIGSLSALSLALTLGLLIANFLTVFASEFWGTVLHYMLTIVSAPMMASGNWAVSLFLWACLLLASRKQMHNA